jgi:hypothetical protein
VLPPQPQQPYHRRDRRDRRLIIELNEDVCKFQLEDNIMDALGTRMAE